MLSSRTPELDGKKIVIVIPFCPNNVTPHWLLRIHLTSNINVVSRQKVSSGNIDSALSGRLNTVFDTVSFTFFLETTDPLVAKNGSKQVKNTKFGFVIVKSTYVPLPWQHE